VEPLKRGYSIERLYAAAKEYVEEAHRSERIDTMDTEDRLLQWNSLFQISDGKLVCRGCVAGQELMDAEQAFPHTEHCQHCQHRHSESEFPW
jgi:hypothetical protein